MCVSTCLQERPEDYDCRYSVRRYYSRRLSHLRKLRFSSLHMFRVFISGAEQPICHLFHRNKIP